MKKVISLVIILMMSFSVSYASSLSNGSSSETSTQDEIIQQESTEVNLADDSSAGTSAGKEVGTIDAIAQGKIDFYEGKSNDYKRSLLTKEQIMKKYRLDKEVEQYRIAFYDGYNTVYQDEYKKAYREGFSNQVMESTYDNKDVTYTNITMDGATVNSSDSVVGMMFDQGAVYLQNNVRLNKKIEKISKEQLADRFIQVSSIYSVEIKNEDGFINVYKPIKMTFKYIGPTNVGVYKKINESWVYYDSKVSGSSIECVIDERTYRGGDYVVLIDKKDKGLIDLENHWAKDEVKLIAKRGWVNGYGDGTFRPYEKITRAEFAVIMYNAFAWYNYAMPENAQLYFTDAYKLSPWGRNAVYQAVVQGIITGYPDGSFRPNDAISYQEIEWLVQKLYKDRGYTTFTWEDMAQVMMDEKGVISKGLTNKENKITRDEVAYMFYILNRGF